MGYQTPNIDRIGREGMMFMDYYGEQSCTAGRSAFITGQATLRTGLSKVGVPGVKVGLQARDATIAELLKPLGYATGQFGKNHLGDRNEFLPTVHSFDEFFGNLYHLNAEEEPEAFRQVSQAETFQGSIEQCVSAIEDELPFNSHVEFAPVLLKFPGVKAAAVGRQAEVDAVVTC
jgi:arylsulfatase A-like enzyme